MPRTKKDPKDQIPTGEQIVGASANLDTEALQPDSGDGQDQNSAGSLPDLELAHTGTLDPDAPQTEAEAGDAGGAEPETGSNLPLEGGPSDNVLPQTDFESDLHAFAEDGVSQTETETASDGQSPGGAPLPEGAVPPFYMAPQEDGAAAGEMAATGQAGATDQAESGNTLKQAEDTHARLRMPRPRGPRVVSIDAERSVETESDRLRSDLLDLVESFKGKKILTGNIQGVERLASNPEICYAVTYHGDFKIIIPVLDAIEEPEDYRDQPKGDVLHYLLNKRLGAEVDYIVKRIDQEGGVVAANRLEAMALKRREYYFRTDRDGNYQIYEGIRAEARVVSVIRAGIFVDLFGAECYIPLRELSYQRWVDAASHYQPGQRVLVKVLEVDRSDRNKPKVTVSVKQASENPYEKALKKYAVGNRYVGTVSLVDLSGVFVSLDGGIDCLCTHPKRGRPPRGARVTVRILGINNETNRIWGVITHMSTTR